MSNLKSWYPQPTTYKSAPYTVEAPNTPRIKGETRPRRNARTGDALRLTPEAGIETVYDILRRSADKYGTRTAVARRTVIRTHDEVKKVKKVVDGREEVEEKKWTYFELSEYHYMTFFEYERLAVRCGAGLRYLGLEAGDRLHIFAATSPFWLAMSHGAASQSMPIVTAYDTLGEDGLKHSLQQTHAKAIYLDPHLLPKLMGPLKEAKDIKHIIYASDGNVKQQDIEKLRTAYPYLTIHSFDELNALGEQNSVDVVPPTPEDLCCIMYTSGSTGPPKGVLLKHKNVVAAVAGADTIYGPLIGPSDRLLTYLPLAHIIELVLENAFLFWGSTLGYGTPRTLSDASVRHCNGDIREFRPTILVGVPAIYEQIKKGIVGKVAASGAILSTIFWTALRAKDAMLWAGLPGAGVIDFVAFKKPKDATGGKIRFCLNGGGPIAKDTQRFLSMTIAPLLNGYGLTETSCMGALMDPSGWTDTALGEIPSCIEIKLVDYAEAGYLSAATPPQGEIWIRGGSVTEGYLDLPEETAAAFTSDGWFRTGDVGEFDALGNLKIIDRIKNLVKTLNGEYIALEKLESIYRATTVVANLCIHALPDRAKPIAIIVPAEPALLRLAEQNGVAGTEMEELCRSKKVRELVLKELQEVGRSSRLAAFEIVEGVVLAAEEWTPQNGFITSAQKLNRKAILKKYEDDIKKVYAK